MLRTIAMRILIALCLMSGLLSGRTAHASMAHGETTTRSNDMDCCPKKPVPIQCPDCVMGSCAVALHVEAMQTLPSVAIVTMIAPILPGDEPRLDDRNLAPPPRPPRSLV